MIVLIDMVMSSVLIAFGYAFTCYYFSGQKINVRRLTKPDKEVIRLSRNRKMYLLFNLLVVILLISMFQRVYKMDVVSQLRLLSLVLIMVPMAVIDFKVQKIPNPLLIVGLGIRIILLIIELIVSVSTALQSLIGGIIGALVIGGFFLLMYLVFKNSIGMGDIKLFALMGLYQGIWGVVNSVFFSLLVSFCASVFLLISRKKHREDSIAFGPSILLGTITAITLSGM